MIAQSEKHVGKYLNSKKLEAKIFKMPSLEFAPVTHCIFDMDGLLLGRYIESFIFFLHFPLISQHPNLDHTDTEHVYESTVRDILKMFGKPYPKETRMRILGTTEQMTAEIAINDMNLPITVAEFRKIFSHLLEDRLNDLSLLRGAERLLRHLHQNNIPIALATSSSKEMAELKMSNHAELFNLFHHRVYGSTDPDVITGKPAPDIFLVAAKRFPDQPTGKSCLVFEDAPNGVRAATLAGGMQTVMVPEKFVAEELRQEATIVLNSLEDFQPELFGLPPFKSSKVPLRNVNA